MTRTLTDLPAEDVRPGMTWHVHGRGYIGRTVESVTHRCNCTAASGAIDPATRERLHYPVVVIAGSGMTDCRLAGSTVVVSA